MRAIGPSSWRSGAAGGAAPCLAPPRRRRMATEIAALIALALASAMPPGGAVAQTADAAAPAGPAAIAAAVPLEVVEVAVGGSWTDGHRSGYYRAIVVQSGGDGARTASVHLQWIAERDGGAPAGVAASTAIREIEGKGLAEASIAIDASGDNAARLTIEAPDAADPALRRTLVLAAGPGKYAVVPPSTEAAGEPAGEATSGVAAAEAPKPAPRRWQKIRKSRKDVHKGARRPPAAD